MATSIGERIRQLREARGWTQDELAEAAEMNRVTVAKYERGIIEPRTKSLAKLAQAFEISADALISGEQASPAEDERDLWELRESVRRDPERKILFDLARHADIEQVKQAVTIIDALKKAAGGGNDEDS